MILVTGGSGLVGNELIKILLAKGHKVRAIIHKTPLRLPTTDALEQMACSLLDVSGLEEVMQGITTVYHCAGLVSFNKKDKHQLYKINVEATANLVNIALESGVQKFLYVSSVSALGRIREDEIIHEKMQWTPETSNSKYGESKYLAEMEVWRAQAEGLTTVIVNPTIILGAGNWHQGSTAIFKSVYEEFPWYATGTTGYVDVRDLVRAMILLMESDVSEERFIISGHNASYQEVFYAIADAFKKKRPHKMVTPFLAALVCKWEAIKSAITGKQALVTKETAATALAKVTFDNSKLLQQFPSFTYIPLITTIKDTCAALQQKINS
ncbi:MAG: NAD-dependent epimerase/dehydratase family protein [Ferruginibacter sp.]